LGQDSRNGFQTKVVSELLGNLGMIKKAAFKQAQMTGLTASGDLCLSGDSSLGRKRFFFLTMYPLHQVFLFRFFPEDKAGLWVVPVEASDE